LFAYPRPGWLIAWLVVLLARRPPSWPGSIIAYYFIRTNIYYGAITFAKFGSVIVFDVDAVV